MSNDYYQVCETPDHTWVVLFGELADPDDPVLTFPAREFVTNEQAEDYADWMTPCEYGEVEGREITQREWALYLAARAECIAHKSTR